MNNKKENNDIFQKKINNFIENNDIKNKELELKSENKNGNKILGEYNYKIKNEDVINALLCQNKKTLDILYFETSNGENSSNQTNQNINIKGLGRFAIYNFIKIAKKKKLEEITFDIKESEIGFYEYILKELKVSNLIKNSYLKNIKHKKLLIIKL